MRAFFKTALFTAFILMATRAVAASESIDTKTAGLPTFYGGTNLVRPPYSGDYLGDVLVGGDFDGDGYEDLFVSSANGDGPDDLGGGSDAYVVFGRPRAETDSLSDLTQRADITLYGVNIAMASGDFDADGYDDLFLAAGGSEAAPTWGGVIYVIFGRPQSQFLTTYDFRVTSADVRIVGDAKMAWDDAETAWSLGGSHIDLNGKPLAYPARSLAVGDVNGDGFDDVLVGANGGWLGRHGGVVFAVLGRPRCDLPAVVDCDFTTHAVHPDVVFIGEGGHAGRLGFSLLAADIDGDGMDDVIMNDMLASGEDNQELTGGEVYVFFGRHEWNAVYDMRLNPFDFALEGRQGYHAGFRMDAGDIDGDHRSDLILSTAVCCGVPDGRSKMGEHRVFFGRPRDAWPAGWVDVFSFTDVLIVGAETYDAYGGILGFDYAVSVDAGNWNGDRFDDLLIGHGGGNGPPYESRLGAGEAYVLPGRPRVEWPPLIDLAIDPDIVIYGTDGWPFPGTGYDGDIFGFDVAMIDFDGSGRDDLFISAPYADGPGNFRPDCGEVSLVFDQGSSNAPPKPRSHPGPAEVSLLPNAPNPFNPATTLRFTAPLGASISLRVYDARGRLVAEPLQNVRMDCTESELYWEARTDNGAPLPSGVYFLKLVANSQTATRKIVLVR